MRQPSQILKPAVLKEKRIPTYEVIRGTEGKEILGEMLGVCSRSSAARRTSVNSNPVKK